MNSSKLVLVTGSAGRVGQAVVKELLARGHTVRGFDRVPTPGLADALVGTITDADAVQRAMQGVKTLVHLAATPDDADFLTELLPNNLTALYLVMEAARNAGVERLILASSGQVNCWQNEKHNGPWPVRVEDIVTPKYWYAATKMFMESIGRSYAEVHGMSVIVARLGWCPRTPEQVREIASSELFRDVYFSPGDAGRFFACAVEAPASLQFATVYATSKPLVAARFDLEPTKRLLGFEPQECWPAGTEIITGRCAI